MSLFALPLPRPDPLSQHAHLQWKFPLALSHAPPIGATAFTCWHVNQASLYVASVRSLLARLYLIFSSLQYLLPSSFPGMNLVCLCTVSALPNATHLFLTMRFFFHDSHLFLLKVQILTQLTPESLLTRWASWSFLGHYLLLRFTPPLSAKPTLVWISVTIIVYCVTVEPCKLSPGSFVLLSGDLVWNSP